MFVNRAKIHISSGRLPQAAHYLYFRSGIVSLMEKFDVHILGCGSALPTLRHFPAAQLVNLREKLFMIDCGEGAQLQFRRSHQKFSRLSHIFISHLHGDHVFGLMGLLSTLSLSGRTLPIHIYAHAELEPLLRPQLDFFCKGQTYEVVFHALPRGKEPQVIYEDRSFSVTAFPLRHRLPTCGFLFCEKPSLPHIRRDMIDFLHIPLYAIQSIKEGADWTTEEGDFYANACLVTPAAPPRAYAYCSDTCPLPDRLASWLHGVDVLYHEATFGEEYAARAVETFHSTARQAAQVAEAVAARRLVIGHFSSRYEDERCLLDEACAVFPATELAHEGMVIHV